MDERLLNVKEIAKFLGVKPAYVYHMVRKRIIPHYRFTRKTIRFKLSEIDQWLKENSLNRKEDELNVFAESFKWEGNSNREYS